MNRNLAPIAKWGTDKKYKRVEDFLLRPSVETQAMETAARILADTGDGSKAQNLVTRWSRSLASRMGLAS